MHYLFLVFSALMLTACSETILLTGPNGEAVATGKMEFHPNPPHQLTIVLNGKTYEGEVNSKEMDNWADLWKRFHADGKHYQRITSGLDTYHHTKQYTGILRASDGSSLTCRYLMSEHGIYGKCNDDKNQLYELHISPIR